MGGKGKGIKSRRGYGMMRNSTMLRDKRRWSQEGPKCNHCWQTRSHRMKECLWKKLRQLVAKDQLYIRWGTGEELFAKDTLIQHPSFEWKKKGLWIERSCGDDDKAYNWGMGWFLEQKMELLWMVVANWEDGGRKVLNQKAGGKELGEVQVITQQRRDCRATWGWWR